MKKPVDFDELFPGRFIKAGELGDKKVTLKISSVDMEELEGETGKKMKGIVCFDGTPKQWVLNRTNATCLREMFGRKVPEWVGRWVTLYAGVWNGEPCVRVWGSPELTAEKHIEVSLPRRKPIKMTMHAVRKEQPAGGSAP